MAESWEAAGDSDEEEQSKEPTRKRVPMHLKIAEREQKEQLEREKAALAAKEEDAATRRARLQQAEVDADLNNAVSLLGSVDIHPRAQATKEVAKVAEPGKLSDLTLFQPKNKQDFDKLRKTLVPLLTSLNEKHGLLFPNFAIEFSRDLCKPLSSDQTRKVASTVNAVVNEKQREERANRGKKPKPVIKQASAKIDDSKDTTNYDDFDDDDFM